MEDAKNQNMYVNCKYRALDYNNEWNRYNIGGVFISWSISGKNIELQYWTTELNYWIELLIDSNID